MTSGIVIPRACLLDAVKHCAEDASVERGGFFWQRPRADPALVGATGTRDAAGVERVAFIPHSNVSARPNVEMEIDPASIAHWYGQGFTPVMIVHSHPSGRGPSREDYSMFPSHYCSVGMVIKTYGDGTGYGMRSILHFYSAESDLEAMVLTPSVNGIVLRDGGWEYI